MPSKQTLIGNIAFELCDTEAPGLKYDKTFGGMQKYIQHQRYSHHVMKEYDHDKNLCKRFPLWVEIRKYYNSNLPWTLHHLQNKPYKKQVW